MKTTKELKELFASGAQDELLKDIYIDEALMDYQRQRYVDAIDPASLGLDSDMTVSITYRLPEQEGN